MAPIYTAEFIVHCKAFRYVKFTEFIVHYTVYRYVQFSEFIVLFLDLPQKFHVSVVLGNSQFLTRHPDVGFCSRHTPLVIDLIM